MIVSMEISLYPIADEYIPPIKAFIYRLRESLASSEGAVIVTNQMSTQVRGELADLMRALEAAVEATFETGGKASVVVKLLNSDLDIARHPHV